MQDSLIRDRSGLQSLTIDDLDGLSLDTVGQYEPGRPQVPGGLAMRIE